MKTVYLKLHPDTRKHRRTFHLSHMLTPGASLHQHTPQTQNLILTRTEVFYISTGKHYDNRRAY